MFYQIKSYITFWRQSTTKFGVHSPFVFDLITKCFNATTDYKKITIINTYKQFLFANDTTINVTDFGAGSRVFKTTHRKVAAIAKTAGIKTKQANLLMRLVAYFETTEVLEIGTSLGIGTLAIALGNEQVKITTLEGCAETIKIPQTNLHHYVKNEIVFKEGEFGKTLTNTIEHKKYDLIYFDGNHQKEATINYFEQCLSATHNDTVFIFDDIHWSSGMTAAWKYIKNHEKVKLTIDTFHWGIVFFRKEQQEKEHFVIRT